MIVCNGLSISVSTIMRVSDVDQVNITMRMDTY